VIYGLAAANSQMGSKDGYPAAAYFIFGSVALLFAAGDVRILVRGGVSGAQRIDDILGAGALRCSSPQGPFSWDSNNSSRLYYAKQTSYFSRVFCH
jgi:hypothetical protein